MECNRHSLASQYWGLKTPKRDSWNGKLVSTMPLTATSLFPALLQNFSTGGFLGENGMSEMAEHVEKENAIQEGAYLLFSPLSEDRRHETPLSDRRAGFRGSALTR